MVLFNFENKQINCKIVYYGTEESGKTTNIEYIHNQMDSSSRSEMTKLESFSNRTMFFDFLSINLGEIDGFKTNFSLYSTPGQDEYNSIRKIILNGVDGIVFVADSRKEKEEENIKSFNNLIENLKNYGLDINIIPTVIQYNKRDTQDIISLERLEKKLNKYNLPSFEATANKGTGVFSTLKAVCNMVIENLQ